MTSVQKDEWVVLEAVEEVPLLHQWLEVDEVGKRLSDGFQPLVGTLRYWDKVL